MSNLLRRSYALSPELVERISSLALDVSEKGLALSDGAIVRLALDRGLPLIEESLLGKGASQDESVLLVPFNG